MIDERRVIERESYDVIVVGGGISGVAAAVAAARNGVSVLLIEKSVNLGGLATSGLISWYEPLCDGKGNQLIYGIAEELIRLSVKYSFDSLPERWNGSKKEDGIKNQRYSTFFSPTVFALALDEFVTENGVKIRFDTLGVSSVMDGKVCKGIICESVGGKEFFGAKMVIDASGIAVVMERAGVPTVVGENFMSYVAHGFDMKGAKKLAEDENVCDFRQWIGVGSDQSGVGHPKGMKKLTGTTADDVTDYVMYGKKKLLERLKNKERGSFDIMTLPDMPQYRTIRRIVGETDFCAIEGQHFLDSIGDCGDFRTKGIGNHYQIPFGALYNSNFPNLIAAGRIISAPQGDGWEVARVIPVCALTGEAAGNAAAFCVKNNCDINGAEVLFKK
ncbi:MAG: FAD-dependent oxidoreductase [Clostridia bacterium]|nr:FAD-dependent oxidoreductase [Clostridia bacterium]